MSNNKLSVEQILAACRGEDGPGPAEGATGDTPPAGDETAAAAAASEAAAKPKSGAGPAKPPGEMSVADILAAAKSKDGGTAAAPPAEAASAGGGQPQPAASAASVDPSKMSMADMLAAARGQGKPPAAAKPAKAVAKPAAAKTKPAAPPAAQRLPRETSSILAAARKGSKPGPMSKEEAAQRLKATPRAKAPVVVPPRPEKPAYARPQPPSAPSGEPRRGFLAVFFGSFLAVGFSSLAAVGGLWSLGLARFMFPNILTEPPSRFKVGFPADFPPEAVATQFKAQFGIWITNTVFEGQRQIVALKSVCTHLGCTPNWLDGERKFKCPCHGSGFYIDGINFEGPAPRPLERYAINIADDGQLEVDKSRKFQQELGQWSNPSSYVAV